MHRVGIVCDSTCDLGPEYLRDHDVRMVPLKVLIDGESYLDWIELSTGEFYRRLAEARELPTTSQPSPADFGETYAALANEGCEEIVSIHLSSPLSGTYQSAIIAAGDASVPIRVVDTKLVTLATGLVVKRAVEVREDGGVRRTSRPPLSTLLRPRDCSSSSTRSSTSSKAGVPARPPDSLPRS